MAQETVGPPRDEGRMGTGEEWTETKDALPNSCVPEKILG